MTLFIEFHKIPLRELRSLYRKVDLTKFQYKLIGKKYELRRKNIDDYWKNFYIQKKKMRKDNKKF